MEKFGWEADPDELDPPPPQANRPSVTRKTSTTPSGAQFDLSFCIITVAPRTLARISVRIRGPKILP